MKEEIGDYTIYRLFRKAGAKRVSKEAIGEMKKVVIEICEKIGKNAIELARHAKRKTVKEEDIILAAS